MSIYGSDVEWPPQMPDDTAVDEAIMLLSADARDHMRQHGKAEQRRQAGRLGRNDFNAYLRFEGEDIPTCVVQMEFRDVAYRLFVPIAAGHGVLNELSEIDRPVVADALVAACVDALSRGNDGTGFAADDPAWERLHDALQEVHYQIVTATLPIDLDVEPE